MLIVPAVLGFPLMIMVKKGELRMTRVDVFPNDKAESDTDKPNSDLEAMAKKTKAFQEIGKAQREFENISTGIQGNGKRPDER